jgi:cytoplasmic iron level regulating protein YaaA (DUF328/UPF0246 family)
MLILLSPAKTLDFSPTTVETATLSPFLKESKTLIRQLKELSAADVSELMGVSQKIAELNVERYHSYQTPQKPGTDVKQALLAFKGDVYKDWPLSDYSDADFAYGQKHLRILSGLYGLLKPLDLIRPYRLEMGTSFSNDKGKNLYEFWGEKLTQEINSSLRTMKDPFVVNLASNEYFRAIQKKKLEFPILTPIFKDKKNGKYKIISFFAKRARGAMAHYLINERVERSAEILSFTGMGYQYDAGGSSSDHPLFLRNQED